MVATAAPTGRVSAAGAADHVVSTRGLKVCPHTVKRWCRRGFLIGGERVRLPARRVGVRYVIETTALDEFLNRVEAAGPIQAAG